MLKYMLIKHKKILIVLVVFGKCFNFEKNFKNFKKLCNPVLATCLAGQASRMPQSRAYTEGFHDSLAGQGPSHKKDLEIFSKIWVFRCLATQFGDLCASGSSNREVYSECFAAPFATSLLVDLLVAKNTQINFSNFVSGVFGDLFATHFSRENCVFCTLRTVFKKLFSFSLAHFDCSLSCSFISLTNSLCFFQKSTIFIIISSSNFKKMYGFSIFLNVFHVYSL